MTNKAGVRLNLDSIDYILTQAIPSMLVALVLCFDYRKDRDPQPFIYIESKGFKYIWCALFGYAVRLVTALGAGVLTHTPQPTRLYLVSCQEKKKELLLLVMY